MSRLLHKWIKPGVGPVLKIMADASYNPETTPNTDYHKFRFNSEVAEIGYSWGKNPSVDIAASALWIGPETGAGTFTFGYYPLGSGASNCMGIVAVNGYQSNQNPNFLPRRVIRRDYPALDRSEYKPLGYRTIFRAARDRSDWTNNYPTGRSRYIHAGYVSVDYRYISQDANRVDLTTVNVSAGGLGSVNLGLTTRHGNPYDSYDYDRQPTWFTPGLGSPVSSYYPLTISGYAGLDSPSDPPVVTATQRLIMTELPLEDDPYPAVSPTFTTGVPCLHLSPTIARMAKPGFNVDMADRSHLIFSQDKFPMLCVKTGFFTLAPSATISFDIDYPITPDCWLEEHSHRSGTDPLIPPWPGGGAEFAAANFQHRIVGQQLQFRNLSTFDVDCRFFLFAGDDRATSVGNKPVLDTDGEHINIWRPGTAGTAPGDLIVSSRYPFLPIVAQGWISGSQLTSTPADAPFWGSRMHVVNFANTGFKPMIITSARYIRNGRYIYQSPFMKYLDVATGGSGMSASSFIVKLEDTKATFYFAHAGSGRMEDAYRHDPGYVLIGEQMQLDGIRYYIFAVPPSL